MKQYLLFWLKQNVWSATQCIIPNKLINYYPTCTDAGHMSKFFYRKHQMTHFLRLLPLLQCKPVLQNGGQVSKGSNSSTFKNVSTDIGVIGYGNTKTVILTKSESKATEKGLTFTGALIFYCTLLVTTCCQNNAIESHKRVISVIKIRGIATFDINVHFCWGLMWDSVTLHRMKQNRKVWKK